MTRAIASMRGGERRNAVAFVAPGETVDAKIARQLWRYCRNRGYDFVALLRDWNMVDHMLGSGQANIVVMPSPESAVTETGGGDTVRLWPPAPVAPAGPDPGPQRRSTGNSRFGADEPAHMANEVASYRSGYADGYLDCATLKDRKNQSR